jgi:hypothetical protein
MELEDKLRGIDFPGSYLMNVIYDDESLTLEMDFALLPEHPKYVAPQTDAEGCYREGYVRFADIGDLRLNKAKTAGDLSTISAFEFKGEHVSISSGWGEVEVTAKSIRVVVD